MDIHYIGKAPGPLTCGVYFPEQRGERCFASFSML